MGEIKRIAVLAVGSGGDVAPMAAVAAKLANRGLETTLLAPQRYGHYIEGTGVLFRTIGADDVFAEVFDSTDIWDPTKGLSASWRYYGAAMRTGFTALRQGWNAADTALVSSSFAVAARLAEECDGYRNTTVHLSPSVIFSAHQPPKWPKASIPPAWPLFVKRALVVAAERFVTDPVIGAQVNPFRAELGLPPEKHLFSGWIHSRRRVIYAFPEWFASPAADWPPNGMFAGFPSGIHSGRPMPVKLQKFLDGAPGPVVVVTAGTAVASRPIWVDCFAEFAVANGAQVVVVEPKSPAASEHSSVCTVPFAPFEMLFPHVQLIVHHAGIGTLAEAIRAGLPQLLVPTAHDQFDNAAHLQAIGLGRVIDPMRDIHGLNQAWHWALADEQPRRALAEARRKLALDADGADRIADIVPTA